MTVGTGSMRALVLRGFGGPEQLRVEDRPIPVPGPGEVLLRVHACAVSPGLDIGLREGRFGFRDLPFPHIPGIDPAGEVVAIGDGVDGFAPGARVVITPWLHCGHCEPCREGLENSCLTLQYMGVHRSGGHAQYTTAPARNVVPIPDSVGYEQAAATAVSLSVAWHLIASRGQLKASETALVQGAAGGFGSAAVQVCKLLGARVIAAAGSDLKLKAVSQLGADHLVNYRVDELTKQVLDFTAGRGVDVVVDSVGAATFEQSLACLAVDGRLLTVGGSSGVVVQLNLPSLYRKHISIVSSANATQADLRHVFELVATGVLRPLVHGSYPLSEAAEAQRVLLERRNIGVVVLNPQRC